MIATLAVFALIGAVELPGLLRRRQWGELILSALFLGAGMALTVFLGVGGELPRLNL